MSNVLREQQGGQSDWSRLRDGENTRNKIRRMERLEMYVLIRQYNDSTFTLSGWEAVGGFEQGSAMIQLLFLSIPPTDVWRIHYGGPGQIFWFCFCPE